jgi:serine/threonine-protein kinase HipA
MVAARIVLLGDQVAGRLERTGGAVNFAYEPAYQRDPAATPISVSMPMNRRGRHADAAVSPWLWGLLPDNTRVLDRWARQFQVSAGNPYSLLATPLGEDCPGAVRIVAPDRVEALLGAAVDEVDWLTESDVAQRIRDLQDDSSAWLGAGSTGRFSLAGAQPKTALLRRDGRWGDPAGAGATTHILKPAIAGMDDHDLNEHLCLTAMGNAGLGAVRTWVERFEDVSAIVVARYDRRSRPGQPLVRLHQEDLAQALGHYPTAKYQNEGGPGPGDVAKLLRRIMPPALARTDLERFTGALVWNWIIAGPDAHAKNYSILLSGGQAALAPFYDVASALSYPELHPRKLRLAMKFGSGYLMDPPSPPWARLAVDLGLAEGDVRAVAGRLLDASVPAFEKAAADPLVAELASDLPQRLVDLVGARVDRCRRLL